MHAPMVVALSEAPTSFERVLEDRKAQISRATNADAELIACPGGCGGVASLESPLSITRDGVTRTVRVAQCLGECRRETRSPRTGKTRLVAARFDVPCWETDGRVDSDFQISEPSADASPQPRQEVVDTVASAEPQPVVEPAAEQLPEPTPELSVDLSGPPSAEPTIKPLAPHRAEPLRQAARDDGGDANQAFPVGIPAEPVPQPDVRTSGPDSPTIAPAPFTEPAPVGEEFPILLRRALKARGITQIEAGSLIGCSQSGVSKMLNGLPVAQSTMHAARAWVQSLSGEEPPRTVSISSLGHDRVSRSLTNGASHGTKNGAKNGLKQQREAPLGGDLPGATRATGEYEVPEEPANKEQLSALEDLPSVEATPPSVEVIASPYEAVLRTVLQQVAQRHLEEIAGSAAEGVVVRVTLEWEQSSEG